mmetsp:Transcript_30604/g.98632  ORF Transcript_30604/g.98632 Transcript_30604/m.98632 type:complete len:222 (+) Transcript_30604:435-1100(+)
MARLRVPKSKRELRRRRVPLAPGPRPPLRSRAVPLPRRALPRGRDPPLRRASVVVQFVVVVQDVPPRRLPQVLRLGRRDLRRPPREGPPPAPRRRRPRRPRLADAAPRRPRLLFGIHQARLLPPVRTPRRRSPFVVVSSRRRRTAPLRGDEGILASLAILAILSAWMRGRRTRRADPPPSPPRRGLPRPRPRRGERDHRRTRRPPRHQGPPLAAATEETGK